MDKKLQLPLVEQKPVQQPSLLQPQQTPQTPQGGRALIETKDGELAWVDSSRTGETSGEPDPSLIELLKSQIAQDLFGGRAS